MACPASGLAGGGWSGCGAGSADSSGSRRDRRRAGHAPADLDPRSGVLSPAPRDRATGTMMTLSRRVQDLAPRRVPALPERCPHCDAGGVNRDPRAFFRGLVRSPIRAHTTGVARVNQVLLDRVVRNVAERPQDGRTIVFTDSRDDAAGTAAGVEVNHFRDLVRQLVTQELAVAETPATIMRVAARDEDLTADQGRLLVLYKADAQTFGPPCGWTLVAWPKAKTLRSSTSTFDDTAPSRGACRGRCFDSAWSAAS